VTAVTDSAAGVVQSFLHPCHPERSRGTLCSAGGQMPREFHFYVYMVQSSSRRALYIGMTNNLHKRIFQHKTHAFEGFTDDYNATRLVYWECFEDVRNAIDREKKLKGWRRAKKLWLIADESQVERSRR
jgi:putative endonuclease